MESADLAIEPAEIFGRDGSTEQLAPVETLYPAFADLVDAAYRSMPVQSVGR